MTVAPSGLCGACRHAREVATTRGSRFILCERSRTDPTFARYPRLPVLACRGYEASPPDAASPDDGGSSDHSSTSRTGS